MDGLKQWVAENPEIFWPVFAVVMIGLAFRAWSNHEQDELAKVSAKTLPLSEVRVGHWVPVGDEWKKVTNIETIDDDGEDRMVLHTTSGVAGSGWPTQTVKCKVMPGQKLNSIDAERDPSAPRLALTDTEVKILSVMHRGGGSAAISDATGIPKDEVASRRRDLYAKLDVASGREAVALALAEGLINPLAEWPDDES